MIPLNYGESIRRAIGRGEARRKEAENDGVGSTDDLDRPLPMRLKLTIYMNYEV